MTRRKFGLLGEHLSHSYSPMIHRYLGDYSYPLFEKAPDEVADFIRNGDFDGINVTIPYKQTVMPFCDELSEQARLIGSVNTVLRRDDGTIVGDNTDFYGFSALVRAVGGSPEGKKALVLGSGGSSKTVCAVLRHLGAGSVTVISRSGPDDYEHLARHADAQWIVNTTPVGMYPHVGHQPLDLKQFPRCEAVLDLIYNPAKTDLLLQAEELGIPCRNGLIMLTAQAKRAAELFLEKPLEDALTESITAKIRLHALNLVLIGMPGCGKSTVSAVLAQKTGRPRVDTDEQIVLTVGKSIEDIFSRDGEAAFRELESAVLAECTKQSGRVIATGGGIVTREENRRALRRNSVVIYLTRDPASLPLDGRPVSQRDGVETLFRQRDPLYSLWADFAVPVQPTPEETAQRILERLNEEL